MPQRIASDASSYLSELGSISSGLLIIVVLAILGGSVIMVSIFAGVNKYREFKENERRRKEEREKRRKEREARLKEAVARGREEGMARGREEGMARGREEGMARGREEGMALGREEVFDDVRTRLIERGIDPDDILPPEENGFRTVQVRDFFHHSSSMGGPNAQSHT